ncbi:hypothetical protein Tco_0589746, partial [Tanacetum coccineum]
GKFNKFLVRKNQTDLENFMKYFSINSTFLLSICISDLCDGVPKLMHVDFREFSSDQERGIARS